MNDAPPAEDLSLESLVARVADEFLQRLECGENPDAEEYVRRHPQHETVLRQVLSSLRWVRDSGAAAAASGQPLTLESPLDGRLGDFRILREVGRGGMGVVYEAEQISLGRRVALKILPFASTLDSKQLQRFKNEAQAAAHLHHTNIVPVHATGCERGVHYYAMQFIAGQTLASVIAELRIKAKQGCAAAERVPIPPPEAAGAIRTVPWVRKADLPEDSWPTAPGEVLPLVPLPPTTPKATISTERSTQSPAYFRSVAQLAVQAAEALEHAHQLGVVHRDIKPANLLVDGRGNLWVTDFGLAHCQGQAGLTMSGDLVGTLRYMSPEQALAHRVTIDHRTDIYSLGATLYELLTLEPAFNGHDRQELLRQIAFEEPRLPRRMNHAIPAELETIVLKAMEKNPAERYVTAQELADDLVRFLRDEPIRAKRPSLLQRLRKWTRRRQAVVWSAAACMLVCAIAFAGSIGWVLRDREARQSEMNNQIGSALQEAELLHKQGKLPEALAALGRAEALAAQKRAAPRPILLERLHELQARLEADRRDRLFAARFDQIRLRQSGADLEKNLFIPESDLLRMKAAFEACYGIQLGITAPEDVTALIQRRPQATQRQLVAALDCCLAYAGETERQMRAWLTAVLEATDADPWRNQVRGALAMRDRPALIKLAKEVKVAREEPSFLLLLARELPSQEGLIHLALLRQIQRAYPSDFWANDHLGFVLMVNGQWDDAIRYLSVAFALRPQSPLVCRNLAIAFVKKGLLDEAILAAGEAVRLKPDYADAHFKLGKALYLKGRLDEAIAALNEAIRLQPSSTWAFPYDVELAAILVACNEAKFRDTRRALELAKKAMESAPQDAATWNTLGVAEYRAGNWEAARAALVQAMELRKGSSYNWFFLAMTHWRLGQMAEARNYFDQAVQWMDKNDPKNEVLRRFRAEAEDLMGISNR